nr:hypothetical protein [Tanacetum cinerariifolium]
MAFTDEERVYVGKESANNSEWVKISIQKVHTLLEMEDNGTPDEPQRNTTDPPVAVSDSLATDYDSTDKSLVCSTPLPPLKKLAGAKPVSGPKTIKSILKSKSTFKAKALKGVIINEPSSYLATGNISTLVLKSNSAHAGKLKNMKMEDNPPLAIVMKELNELKLQISKNKSYDHDTHGHNMIISLRRGIKLRNPQHVTKNYETCGSNVHTTTDHNDIELFRKRKALQAKKGKKSKTSKTESSSALRLKTPTKRYQANPKESHLIDVKRIFRKSTSITCQFLGGKLMDIELHFIPTQYQLVDIFTKPLDEPTFKTLIVELDLIFMQQCKVFNSGKLLSSVDISSGNTYTNSGNILYSGNDHT